MMFLPIISRSSDDLPTVLEDAQENYITNIVAFLGYTILVWDHIITLPDEIEHIWKGRKSPLVYLFLVNRYFTPLSFIGNLVAYFANWSPEVSVPPCDSFVRFEGASTIIGIEITALMMLQRVKALYSGNHKVIGFVIAVLLLETAVNAWLMTHAQAVEHNPDSGVKACTMIFDPKLGFWPSLSAWLPLIYDTIVITLTLYKCMGPVHKKTASHIVRTLLRDGLLYYSVIFAINFILAIMIVAAPPGIKNITAQLEFMLTVAMMSRITLNLRREASSDGAILSQLHPYMTSVHPGKGAYSQQSSDGSNSFEMGNLNKTRSKRGFSVSGGQRGMVKYPSGGFGFGHGYGYGNGDLTVGDRKVHVLADKRQEQDSPDCGDESGYSSHRLSSSEPDEPRSFLVGSDGRDEEANRQEDVVGHQRVRLSDQEISALRILRPKGI